MKKIINKKGGLALIFLALLSGACNRDKDATPPPPAFLITQSESLAIPASIDFPANAAGHTRVATFYAEGVQKYVAKEKPGTNPVSYEWSFVAPQANLYDITNSKVGSHTAGPSWQLSSSDSIFAQAFTPAKTAPSPDPGSIPWLLLKPKEGKIATGLFANVDYIQRIATIGGVAPASAPAGPGETKEVKYTAIYRFTKKN
jgi:hypothetical protein